MRPLQRLPRPMKLAAALRLAASPRTARSTSRGKPKPLLTAEPSAALRDQLIAEIQNLTDGEEIAAWARQRLPAKNTLTADDARAVETACQVVLSALNSNTNEFEQSPGGPDRTHIGPSNEWKRQGCSADDGRNES